MSLIVAMINVLPVIILGLLVYLTCCTPPQNEINKNQLERAGKTDRKMGLARLSDLSALATERTWAARVKRRSHCGV